MSRCIEPIEDGHIPDSYVALVEDISRSQLTSFFGGGEGAPFYGSNLPKKGSFESFGFYRYIIKGQFGTK